MIPLSCACGAVTGSVATRHWGNPATCHCIDCQTYAAFLGTPVLDAQGGTTVLQVAPSQVTITAGHAQLAAVRLSPRGLMRWYAACCRTPLGNSLPHERPLFLGVTACCLPEGTVADAPRVNQRGARPPARDRPVDLARAIGGALLLASRAALTGARSSPFPPPTSPAVRVLTLEERQALRPQPVGV